APVAATPFTVSAPLVGAAESSVKASVVPVVLPAASAPVTTSVGELDAPCVQPKVFESKGPPAGVDTVDGVCDQPLVVPPRAAVAEEATPESESPTALVSLNEPPPTVTPR